MMSLRTERKLAFPVCPFCDTQMPEGYCPECGFCALPDADVCACGSGLPVQAGCDVCIKCLFARAFEART